MFDTLVITPCNGTVRDNVQIGDMGGERALEIVTTYVSGVVDFVIYGKCSDLLDGAVDRFPEVSFDY